MTIRTENILAHLVANRAEELADFDVLTVEGGGMQGVEEAAVAIHIVSKQAGPPRDPEPQRQAHEHPQQQHHPSGR